MVTAQYLKDNIPGRVPLANLGVGGTSVPSPTDCVHKTRHFALAFGANVVLIWPGKEEKGAWPLGLPAKDHECHKLRLGDWIWAFSEALWNISGPVLNKAGTV